MTRERKRWSCAACLSADVLDRAANRPLYRQIEVSLRRSILDGRIGPGTVLPGIRAYAKHLGVAAVTS
jgi:DNA-binding transcriptional regulator YhcF (GntR family)